MTVTILATDDAYNVGIRETVLPPIAWIRVEGEDYGRSEHRAERLIEMERMYAQRAYTETGEM